MIGKLVKIIVPGIAYLCVGTVVAQAVAVTYLVATGALTRDRFYELIATAYGVDVDEMERQLAEESGEPSSEQASIEAVITRRAMIGIDQDLREQALRHGLDNLSRMQNMLVVERERYDNLKQGFDNRLTQLQQDAEKTALTEVQETLENIQPKQAKEQILLMIDEEEETMDAVVAILKAMSIDRRKKIIGEFKTEEEMETLHEILRHVRMGDQELIEETRKQLAKFNSDKQP